MIAVFLGLLVGSSVVFWSLAVGRDRTRHSVFEDHPYVGVALICLTIVLAAWVDVRT